MTPAATLLLPYFEVDFASPAKDARTTLFTVVNVSSMPQIARVTLWTDWSFPALTFDLYLTGFDVQSVNLRDVFNGAIPQSAPQKGANPNHLASMTKDCAQRPREIPERMLADLRTVFTTGKGSRGWITCKSAAGAEQYVGSTHPNASGYVTIDVVATCSSLNPSNAAYYRTDLLFDNVLTGDYEMIDPNVKMGNFAGGAPLVHIRAIPEGGPAGSNVATNLPYTFYDRLTNEVGAPYARTVDRRQPLPSTFAARLVEGGGANDFQTHLRVWREGFTPGGAECRSYVLNSNLPIADVIRFDEHENAKIIGSGITITPPPGQPGTSATGRLATTISLFPPVSGSADAGGWMYLNFNNFGSTAYSTTRRRFAGAGTSTTVGRRQSQNWVSVEMSAEGRYSVIFDAAQMANGCSVAPPAGSQIVPGANATP